DRRCPPRPTHCQRREVAASTASTEFQDRRSYLNCVWCQSSTRTQMANHITTVAQVPTSLLRLWVFFAGRSLQVRLPTALHGCGSLGTHPLPVPNSPRALSR